MKRLRPLENEIVISSRIKEHDGKVLKLPVGSRYIKLKTLAGETINYLQADCVDGFGRRVFEEDTC